MGGNNIEATGVVCQVGMRKQIVMGRGDQAFLFSPIDRFHCIAPLILAPVAYFHKYYCIRITHDQIELALLAAVIARQKAHPRLEQKLFGQAFRLIPQLLPFGQLTHLKEASSSTDTILPSRITPQPVRDARGR